MRITPQNLLVAVLAASGGLLVATSVPSCANKDAPQPRSPLPVLADVQQGQKAVGDTLKQTTGDIKRDATAGQKATPPAVLPTLNPYWSSILTSAGKQDVLVTQLQTMQGQLDQATKQTKTMEQWGVAQQSRAAKAEESTTKELRQKYMAYSGWLFFLALIAGGIAIAGRGPLASIGGAVACLAAVGSAVAIFVAQSVALIPWIVGGLSLAIIAYVVYLVLNRDKLKTVTADLVKTTEVVKESLPDKAREKLFGDKGLVNILQAPETRAVVADARDELPDVDKALDLNGDGLITQADLDLCDDPEKQEAIKGKIFTFKKGK